MMVLQLGSALPPIPLGEDKLLLCFLLLESILWVKVLKDHIPLHPFY